MEWVKETRYKDGTVVKSDVAIREPSELGNVVGWREWDSGEDGKIKEIVLTPKEISTKPQCPICQSKDVTRCVVEDYQNSYGDGWLCDKCGVHFHYKYNVGFFVKKKD